jgi:hypothetical protein
MQMQVVCTPIICETVETCDWHDAQKGHHCIMFPHTIRWHSNKCYKHACASAGWIQVAEDGTQKADISFLLAEP